MEDTLGVWIKYSRIILLGVLILVLMEDTLEVKISCSYSYVSCWVLILVLMEDTLEGLGA